MPRIPIDDIADPRLAPYRSLKASNESRDRDTFIVEGAKLVERLAESRFPMVSALATDRAEGRIADKMPDGVPLYVVPHEGIDLLVGFNFHQGALAQGRRLPWPDPLETLRQAGERATVVICPRLDNPENLGSLVRIADAFGVDGLLVGPRCPDPLSRRVLRVSMGSSLRLPVIAPADLRASVDHLRNELGFALVATVASPDAAPLPRSRRPDRLALLLGPESAGLDEEWVAVADRRVTVPMRAGIDSLNVAVAAGIILYEWVGREA